MVILIWNGGNNDHGKKPTATTTNISKIRQKLEDNTRGVDRAETRYVCRGESESGGTKSKY